MPSFIRPTYKIVMEEFSSWRPCLGCFHSSRRSSPTADIKDRNLRKRLQKFGRISTLKSSNVPIRSADLWSCPNAGSWTLVQCRQAELRMEDFHRAWPPFRAVETSAKAGPRCESICHG